MARRVTTAMAAAMAALALGAGPAAAQPAPAPIVFFDLVGGDLDKLSAFYAEAFGWKLTAGAFPTMARAIAPLPVISPMPGMLRREAAGSTHVSNVIYIGVEDVTAALAKVQAAGGKIETPRLVVPGASILGLFRDPAGNLMGLIEMEGGKPKVP